ncbi:MAG: uroporphyrinogen decarboxylase family protein [Armatimonadota bacterium]|nr:uroporphyrinogen decarboxylase family protein [Armatimonadota bacterium]
MTPKERAIAAFELREPDDIVPTFELQFQLSEALLGKKHATQRELDEASPGEKDRLLSIEAELYVEEAERLDYSIISVSFGPHNSEDLLQTIRRICRLVGEKYLIAVLLDGTMGIPNGQTMMTLSMRLTDDADGLKAEQDRNVDGAIEYAKRLADAGVGVALMVADYCFNDGPFLSPAMFREFVTPYLARQVSELKKLGLYTVKHTDGNIMPILDQLVESGADALHSIDPQAGVDLKEVKRLVGDRIALCGNVRCDFLQSRTVQDAVTDAERSLRDGMPGGGYFFCTSNTPFIGMPLENYLAALDVRRRLGWYKREGL